MVDYPINVIINPSGASAGAAQVKAELDGIAGAAQKLQGLIAGALSFAGIGFGVKALADLADAYTNAQNRIRTVTDSNIQLEVVMDKVFDTAQKTGVALNTVVNVYQRVASGAKSLGLSQQQFLDITQGIVEAGALSGSSTQKLNFGLQEIANAMGQASIKGREMRAVLNDVPAVAQAIVAQLNRTNPGLNATTASLKELATQGKLTPKLIADAFSGVGLDAINDKFAHLQPTISRAFQTLRTDLVKLIGDFNTSSGVQGTFAAGILYVADNLDTFARILLSVSVLLGVNFALNAMGAALKAVRALFIALRTNPLVAFGNILILVTSLLVAFGDQINLGGGHVANFQDLATAAWQDIKTGAEAMYNWFATYFPKLTAYISDVFGGGSWAGYITNLASGLDTVVTLFLATGAAIATAFSNIPAAFKLVIGEAFNGIFTVMTSSLNLIIDAINTATSKLSNLAKLNHVTIQPFDLSSENKALNNGPVDAFANQLANPSTAASGAAKTLLDQADAVHNKNAANKSAHDSAYNDALNHLNDPGTASPQAAQKLDTFDNIIAKIKGETDALTLNKQARALADEEVKVEYQLKTQLSPAQKTLLDQYYQEYLLQKQKTAILDQLRGPQEDLVENTRALNSLLAEGAINQDQYNQQLNRFSQAAIAANRDLTSGLQRGLLQIQEQFGNVADLASKTLVDAFQKAEDALVTFAETGKISFKSLITSMIDDLTRLAIRQNITAPLANALGIGGSSALQGGLLSGLGASGGLLGGLLQNSRPTDFIGPVQQTSGNFFGSIGAGLSSLGTSLGFATGGSFEVGGQGGVDSQMVNFRATPGEVVNVTKPGSGGNSSNSNSNAAPMTVNFNISTPDVNGFRASQSQLAAQAHRLVARGRRNS